MQPGLFLDGLPHLDRAAAFAWCASHGISAVELGVSSWALAHHLDLDALLADPAERDRLQGELREFGLSLSCVNAASNPLHPDPVQRRRAQERLRGAVRLAHALGVGTVVTMSGTPGGREPGNTGVFGCWSVVPDDEGLWEWQFTTWLEPFWREFSRWARQEAPGVRVCLELHPGCAVWSIGTFQRLEAVTRPAGNVGVNLDPSHFWWQGVDPLAVVEELGPFIGHCHGKDTRIYPERVRRHGVLDHRWPVRSADAPWHFAAIGTGHDLGTWRALLGAMRAAGYDGVVSIEHEDPSFAAAEEAILVSLANLRQALDLDGDGVTA